MVKAKREHSYLLPHNPLTAAGVLAELKRLKGDKAWLEFELELVTGQYPDNAIFRAALEQYRAKAAAAATPPPSTTATEHAEADKVTSATNATTDKASTKANGNKAATPPGPKGKAANKKEAK